MIERDKGCEPDQAAQQPAANAQPKIAPLAGVASTRKVLDEFGLSTKKALGQHFLINEGVVRRICDLSDLHADDSVMEIGPGIGTLTQALLACAGRVVAIERDADLPAVLRSTCAAWESTFTLMNRDALEVGPADLPYAVNKLVSNLPYAVAATLVLDAFERFDTIESATVMVQAEVADRMAAQPGTKDYGAYTVKLHLFALPAKRFSVSPGNFFPPPRVNSSVIRLNRRNDWADVVAEAGGSDLEAEAVRQATMTMADAAFASRRKTIANSCKTYFSGTRQCASLQAQCVAASLPNILEEAGIDSRRRVETLSVQEFTALGCAALRTSVLS